MVAYNVMMVKIVLDLMNLDHQLEYLIQMPLAMIHSMIMIMMMIFDYYY